MEQIEIEKLTYFVTCFFGFADVTSFYPIDFAKKTPS